MKNLILIISLFLLFSCSQDKTWTKARSIDLGKITPIGLTYSNGNIWLADGDHNQIVEINLEGEIQKVYDGFERPMHIDANDGAIYIPEYGTDNIIILKNGQKTTMAIQDSLDAPAGVSIFKNEKAIADFYNHRILYFNGTKWISFGEEGKASGEFYYPTDVQITKDKIYVADAYNNRVQVFDKNGKAELVIGNSDGINAATGVYVSDKQVFVTDFENDRVLVYNTKGTLMQIFEDDLEKPTDILMINKEIYVSCYKGKKIIVFQ